MAVIEISLQDKAEECTVERLLRGLRKIPTPKTSNNLDGWVFDGGGDATFFAYKILFPDINRLLFTGRWVG